MHRTDSAFVACEMREPQSLQGHNAAVTIRMSMNCFPLTSPGLPKVLLQNRSLPLHNRGRCICRRALHASCCRHGSRLVV